jgi:hypothetical protein
VCAVEFSPKTLDQKLQSVEWVAGLARKHETVLEQAMRHGAVVPARLCTLFSTAEALKRSLSDNEARFQAALARIAGREEWALKVFCDEARLREAESAEEPTLQALDAALAGASPGGAFVLRKRREARLTELVSLRLDELVDDMLDALELVSDDARLRPLLSEAAAGRERPMVLNVAALVPVSGCESFRATLADLSARYQEDGLLIELTGPWPAYSFCDDEIERVGKLSEAGR